MVTILANTIVAIKAISKKTKLLFALASIILLSITSFLVYQRVIELKQINTLDASVDLTAIDGWDSFTNYISTKHAENLDQNIWDTLFNNQQLASYARSVTPELKLDEVVSNPKYKDYKLIDFGCLTTTVNNSIAACHDTIKIFNNIDNPEKIVEIMDNLGVSKHDKIIAYCAQGWTSVHIAFILSHYGYNASYASLNNIADPSILDHNFSQSHLTDNIIIKKFSLNPKHQYFYILINDADQWGLIDHQGQLNSNTISQLKIYTDNSYILNNPFALNHLNDADISYQLIDRDSFVSSMGNNNSGIICWNKLHCYLTRHYLNSFNIKRINTLFCLDCLN